MLKPHEIETYRQLETMLKTHRQCCLIAGTGVGKSRISSHFVETYKLNALIISHRTSINDEWKSWGSPYITTITTQYFYMHYEEFTTGFDIYIFDECQYLGAPKWGEAYDKFKLLIPEDAYILGLTATPKRYERNLIVNIAEKAFGGHIVYGIEKEEAIRLGVIHRSSYVYAIYNAGELVVKYSEKDMTDELRGSLDTFRNMPQIKDILIKHAPKDAPKKGIVYMHDIDSIEEGEVIIRETFPDEQIWSIHSNMPKNDTNKYREEFKKSESGFLVNVDMASEGLHYPGVNMIIMLSKTGSPNKFKQRVGRGSNTPGCVVFDLVGSFVSVRKTLNRIGKDIVGFTKSSSGFGFEEFVSDQEIVYDYVTDLFMVLQEIDGYNNNRWTPEECEILKKYYPTEGPNVCKRIPKRSYNSCKGKAIELGLVNARQPKWTPEEDEILKKYYPEFGSSKVVEILRIRDAQSCAARASKLGIKRSKIVWTPEEIEILKKYYPTEGSDVCKRIPGKDAKSCKDKANRLGIGRNVGNAWTPEEIEILKKYYPTEGSDVCKRIPGRDGHECGVKANRLGIKRNTDDAWSPEEIRILKEYYPTEGTDVCKRIPKRSKSACENRAHKLGIKSLKPKSKWTPEEDEILKKHYPTEGSDVCKRLDNRSRPSCRQRAITLGLKCIVAYWDQEEIEILKKYYPTEGSDVCKRIPGKDAKSCKDKANRLGIKFRYWSPEEIRILKEYYPTEGPNVCKRIPKRSRGACQQKANILGLYCLNSDQ